MKKILFSLLALSILFLSCSENVTTPKVHDLAITAPTSGQVLGGTIYVRTSVNNSNIKTVKLIVQSEEKAIREASPFNFSLNLTSYSGLITIFCQGFDENETLIATSNIVNINVDNGGNVEPGQ